MEYRVNRRTGDQISIIGLGTSSIWEAGEKEGTQTLELAFEKGINFFDMGAERSDGFSYYGKVFGSVRKKVLYQIHFGACYEAGEYGWSLELDDIVRSVDCQLQKLKTDYIDYGFIHCIDEEGDFDTYVDNGVLAHLLDLKRQGIVRHIGLSTHTPSVAEKILDTGLVDMLMFSINPAYDYHHGEYGIGVEAERTGLYRRCQVEGVGITAMKIFMGGQLLDEKASPFGAALTELQCMQYALDKPGVLTVVPGIRGKSDLERLLAFTEAGTEERDYSVIGTFAPQDVSGKCVYCDHCRPCPADIPVGLVNKYYDLSKAGDALAKEHYLTLEKKAGDCIDCGHCDSRCPFEVKQSLRMKEIDNYFGK